LEAESSKLKADAGVSPPLEKGAGGISFHIFLNIRICFEFRVLNFEFGFGFSVLGEMP
jgi:hypothetical protein